MYTLTAPDAVGEMRRTRDHPIGAQGRVRLLRELRR
jgi:hypothetical protein